LLRCRVRYFTDGRILGSEAFVREQAVAQPPPASVRPPGPKPMRGANWRGLSTLGGLRKDLFG
ncbi:MAG: transposase, partial [Verrucomicrobiota bacterium]